MHDLTKSIGTGLAVEDDYFNCIMCGEEYAKKPQRCTRCTGTLFEFHPGYARKSEIPDPELVRQNKSGRKSREQLINEDLWCLTCDKRIQMCSCSSVI